MIFTGFTTLQRILDFIAVIFLKLLITLARKRNVNGITICDIGGRASVTGPRFIEEASDWLRRLELASPKLHSRVKKNIKYIAHASIPYEYQYYARGRILLLGSVDAKAKDYRCPKI